jgi:asparagine N-glycosylation enzyme membrane subunit Stt3
VEKRLIAPVAVTVCVVLLCVFFAVVWFVEAYNIWVLVSGLAFMIAIIGISIYVLLERIKEIRSGFEDDLGKY